MDESLVHDELVASAAATHVVVIGVGDYPHLLGGSADQPTDYHDGMGQLTSPPVSVRAFARWMIEEFHHPDKPLATVSLLLAEKDPKQFENPTTRKKYDVTPAAMANAKRAVRNWKERGHSHPDNLLIFFFSGHGISQGPDTALLLNDFGAAPDNVLEGAVDFAGLHLGMTQCAAQQQVYFVDACRANSDTLIETFEYSGDPIILANVRDVRRVRSPVYYSTLAGAKAYGRLNQPSQFTEVLLKALDGGGADDMNDDWRVDTTRLKHAIDVYLNRLFESGERRAQTPATDNLTTFDLHFMTEAPSVDVTVQCSPDEATSEAEFDCRRADDGFHRQRVVPSREPWEIDLPTGNYQFSAEFGTNHFLSATKQKHIRPPYRIVRLDVPHG